MRFVRCLICNDYVVNVSREIKVYTTGLFPYRFAAPRPHDGLEDGVGEEGRMVVNRPLVIRGCVERLPFIRLQGGEVMGRVWRRSVR